MKKLIFVTLLFFLADNLCAQDVHLAWAKQMGGASDDRGLSIAIDATGNVYTTGYFDGTVDFDPGAGTYNLTSVGNKDIFISKFNSAGSFVWARDMGGTGYDQSSSIAIDASGNVYTTGSFSDTVDFDPGPGTYNLTSTGSSDIFVSKLDASGNFVWAKSIGSIGAFDVGSSIAIDASGNIYTTGSFSGIADFDPGSGTYNLTASSSDIFVSKLDADGNFVWAKDMGGTSYDYCASIAVDASDNVYTTGYFQGTADFDPALGTYNLTAAGNQDIFVCKLDASGNFVWAKSMGGISGEAGISIAVDASGNVYTTGFFSYIVDFDPGPGTYNLTSTGSSDIFVSKLDASGNFIWAKDMGSDNGFFDVGSSIALDISGNIYTTGFFSGTADFDPGPGVYNLTSANYTDNFISKLDASGNFLWAKNMGGDTRHDDGASSIAVDISGNVYATGYFNGTADFDPGAGTYNLTSVRNDDIFVMKLSGTGVVTDIDGNLYHTVTIGTQVWMVENLKTTHYRNGDPIPNITDDNGWNVLTTGAYCWYNNDSSSNQKYGALYNQYVIKDARNICPNGWHIPSVSDWENLAGYLGGYSIAGGKLKEEGTESWLSPNTGATNETGFTALPGGYRTYSGAFNGIGNFTYWWSVGVNPVYGPEYPWLYNGGVEFEFTDGSLFTNINTTGFSIRCIKDTIGSTLIYPKLTLNTSSVNGGQSIAFIGTDFKQNGSATISLLGPGGFSQNINNININGQGAFVYNLVTTTVMLSGEYNVSSTDVTTGNTTSTIKFKVNNSSQNTLWINKPLANDAYLVNQLFQVQWGDYIDKSLAIGKSGFVQKTYNVAVSNDNGATWFSESDVTINNAIPGINNNDFSTTFGITTAGTYRIRITDADNPSDMNISDPFNIVTSTPKGFSYSFEWDKSSPLPDGMPHPVGLAADGTSRIFIKLLRSTGKVVSNITASIHSIGDSYNGIDLLGKVMYASNHLTYNEEANAANSTSYPWPAVNGNEFWFWLVAPNDFTQDPSDQRSERKIKVDFTITYSDNSSEVVSTDQTPLDIVRPPLFLVHGINGDSKTFADLKYNVDGTSTFFNTDHTGVKISNSWKVANRLNLYNYGSFAINAEVVLGINSGDNEPNSFQATLKAMHNKGYACNKVDYVAHSMGGCIARTIINLYVDSYKPPLNSNAPYRNYSQGFINKLITLNTPHNGAEIADLVNDVYPYPINPFLNPVIFDARFFTNLLNGFFVQDGFDSYKVSPALHDLQAFHGGIRFNTTTVKNHLIGSDLDKNDNIPELLIRGYPSHWNIIYNTLYTYLLLPLNSVYDFMKNHYSNYEYLSNSDFMVPISSQLLDRQSISTDIYNNPLGQSNSSIIYGISKTHTDVTSDTAVGSRIMHLLNAPINSGYFVDNIEKNPNDNGDAIYKPVSITSFADSIKSYYDKTHIAIESPNNNSIILVDSSITVQVNVADTIGLQQIRLMFQSQLYQSDSKESTQTFNIQVNSNQIGKDKVVAEGIYDSSGYTVNHIDTITLNVKCTDPVVGFYITPKSITLNPGQTFQPVYNAICNTYIGVLNNDIDSLNFNIADTNVVRFDSSSYQFIAKDTGTTHIIFSYKGFADTMFVLLTSTSVQSKNNIICPGSSASFTTPIESGMTYQWQLDTGNGFTNINNDAIYSNANTNVLSLNNAPTSWYGYRYQCLVSNGVGYSTTAPITLKFSTQWAGTMDSTWENAANWSCGNLPDSNTDVIIKPGVSNFPNINSNVSCRSLTLNAGAMVKVKTGYRLNIVGKNE